MKNNNLNKLIPTFGLILMTFITTSVSAQKTVNYPGYKLIEKRFVKEVNAECYFFEHIKSGAHIVKIAANDPNKTFSIGFKTIPTSDNGMPHIMEHSVLNGSKNFPVKSPFDILSKGSLNTFLNAFTSKDFTMYPVASMNNKDYFNLMHIYLDAVFNPLIYTEPRILKQEGWHYELTNKDSAIVYKGVVYNEMKGAYSDPSRELSYQMFKNLFPDNGYGFESGGLPSAIPTFTQEDFINFHKRFYHPENCYIFLYGDGDMSKELKFMDKEYLSKYKKANNRATVMDQKPFKAMKDVKSYYPVVEGANTKNQTYLSLDIVAGHGTEPALNMSLDILSEVLVNQESAPIRLALQNAGIGEDVYATTDNYQQNVFQIVVQNANASDKDKFYEIVTNTLKDVAQKGIDKETMEGVINRMEFRLREGNDAQKGLSCVFRALPGCLFKDNPFLGLEYEKPLAKVKTALTNNYLEGIINTYLLNNPHSLLLTVEPKPGLEKERAAEVENQLKKYKASLSNAELDKLVTETNELIAYQNREDSPEALKSIPLLDIKDINPKASWYGVSPKQVDGVQTLHYDDFANGIIYSNLYFDLRVLPQDKIPYASLLSNLIGLFNTENYNYGDLNKALNKHTGGFYTSLTSFSEEMNDNKLIPKFVVTSKAMKNKTDKMFELSSEILNKTIYSDTARLKSLLIRHKSQLDANVKSNGSKYASCRLSSYISNQGMFNELTDGLEYYWFICNIVNNFDKNSAKISATLKQIATLLFTKDNMIAAVTCDKKDWDTYAKNFQKMVQTMPKEKPVMNNWAFNMEKKNEGLQTASKIQYVIEGYNFKKLGYQWDGKIRVLNQILSTDWLQTRIRVVGGAYGGYSVISTNGNFTFNSYRDPNLKETLDNYQGTVDYLANFKADKIEMTRYIIGTIAGLDDPLTTSQKGNVAINYYFNKRKAEDIQCDRDAILKTTQDDIRNYSKMVQDIINQHSYCVYGNADKINNAKDIFNKVISLQQ